MNYTQFLKQIKTYKPTDKLAVLIRHADRDKIPANEFGNDVLLNETGKEHSIEFGRELVNLTINKIFTSPIQRCVQTSELIVKGYGKSVEIEQTKALGAPGLHIADDYLAGQSYLQLGFDELYRRFMNSKEIPGNQPLEIFCEQMTDFINEHTTEIGITLFVTHDALIAFYHYCLEKRVYNTKTDWVNYLTGLIVKI